eukprot:1818746-Alexandrium_andersonii.AAC.1
MVGEEVSPKLDPDRRLAKAKSVFGQLAKRVLTSRVVDACTRVSLFFSLVMSVLLYNCETWAPLTNV